MSPTPPSDSRNNGIVAALGVLILLIGTATGNAYAMCAMAIVALLAAGIFDRQLLQRKVLVVATFAAAVAVVVAVAITKL